MIPSRQIMFVLLFLTSLCFDASSVGAQAGPTNTPPDRIREPGDTATILLKAWIASELPEIDDPQTTDWQRVTLLRDWTHRHMDWATSSARLEVQPGFSYAEHTAADLFAMFLNDQGGVYCGGAAITLRKLYEAYGYEAATLDSGFPESQTTHVVTVVKIRHGEHSLLSVQDPTFNETYIWKDGEPADVIEMIESMEKREGDSFQPSAGAAATIDLLLDPKDKERFSEEAWQQIMNQAVPVAAGWYKTPRTMQTAEQFMSGNAAIEFHTRNYPAKLHYLLLHLLSVTGSTDEEFDRLAMRIEPSGPGVVSATPIATRLNSEQTEYLAANTSWTNDGLTVTGPAAGRHTYLVKFEPVQLDTPRELVIEGEIDRGGILFGVTRNGAWHKQMTIQRPGAFRSSIAVDEPGVYTVIISNHLVRGPVVNETRIHAIGWSQ